MIGCKVVRNLLKPSVSCLNYFKPSYSTTVEKWDIFTAVCLERLPAVAPPLNEIQTKFKKTLEEIETAQSYKCEHELRHEQDLSTVEKLKSDSADLDDAVISMITAQDFEDAATDELAQFKFASIETDADVKKDLKSLERKLQSHLILLVEQNVGNDKKFILPQGKYENGESLRQTAERVLKETCGDNLNVVFFGNAPCGFMKYKIKRDDAVSGVKLFFYYAQHVSGQVKNDTKFKWLTRNEMKTMLDEKYHTTVNNFLVDERP